MNITANVIKLDCTKGAYSYVIKSDYGVTLIDTCFPGKGKKILKELETYGIQPMDIRRIILTHGDADHIGNIAYLSEKCNCTTFISRKDLPYAKGEKKAGGIKSILGIVIKPKLPKMLDELPERWLNDIEIIEAPGHTPGHVCFKFENVLFAGDLVMSSNGKLFPSPAIVTWDKKKVLNSCKNINLNGIDFICPAHGEPVQSHLTWSQFEQKYL